MKPFSLCVYCGSRLGESTRFAEAARKLLGRLESLALAAPAAARYNRV